MIRNPTEKEVRDIIANHNRNEVNEQVGAFVYSHLKSINESNYPSNLTIAQKVLKIVNVKSFKTEFLRHSKAWQKSYYNGNLIEI